MFLGNLSNATERQARKAKKKSTKNDSEEELELIEEPQVKKSPPGEKTILYREETGDIPREELLRFLRTCMSMMLDKYHIREMINSSYQKKLGLHLAAIEFQRDVLENNFQIEKNYGCKYLSMLGVKHKEDTELIEAAKDFMFTCMKCYVTALKMRHKMYKSGTLQGPSSNESMSRTSIMEFFEGCNALMAMPESKAELKSTFEKTQKLPNEKVVEMQRGVIKLIGFNPDFGVSCLNRINTDYPQDRELMIKMQHFALCAEISCQEATFTEEQKANFYKTVPPLMHHFPYMHILQQRMMQQQQFAQTNQMDSRSQQIDALKQTGILSLLSSQEGRQKLQNLATRVQESKTRLSDEISTWGDEQKDSFFDSFHEHPALQSLKNSGEEPIGRITKFLDLSDSELDDMMKLMLVISTSGEKYSKNLSQTGDGADTVDEKQLMQGIVATLGSLSTMNTQGRQHVHDANCGHGQGQGSSNSFTGKADRMDR